MSRDEFYNAIRDDFFEELTCEFELLKDMVRSVAPIFGELKVEIAEKEDGSRKIVFIDVDQADIVLTPEGVEPDEEVYNMTTTAMTIHVNKYDVITIVEHNFNIFTPANKKNALVYLSLIGKKIDFGEA